MSNPYGCNETSTLSMYRRPLPSANLRFLSTLMWDGRESSTQTGTTPIAFPTNPTDLLSDLKHQSMDATTGHAQATKSPSPDQQREIVAFEMALFTAQRSTQSPVHSHPHGKRRTEALADQPFFVGINDPLGLNPFKTAFNPVVFTLYNDSWAHAASGHAQNGEPHCRVKPCLTPGPSILRELGASMMPPDSR